MQMKIQCVSSGLTSFPWKSVGLLLSFTSSSPSLPQLSHILSHHVVFGFFAFFSDSCVSEIGRDDGMCLGVHFI